MSALRLASTSAANDAAWVAANDIADIAARLGLTYRLVGGVAVTLLTHHHGVAHLVPERETADADMAVRPEICASPELAAALRAEQYTSGGGSRFERAGPPQAAIDVLTVDRSGTHRVLPGAITADAFRGMHVALTMAPTRVELEVTLRSGGVRAFTVDLVDVRAALVLKAYAYASRWRPEDAQDTWRLLAAADAAGWRPDDWPDLSGAREAAASLHLSFGRPQGFGARAASADRADQARVRLLTARVIPQPAP